jgi:hypothetical protein
LRQHTVVNVTRVRIRKEEEKLKKRGRGRDYEMPESRSGQESRYGRMHSIAFNGAFFPLATIKLWTKIKNRLTGLWQTY